MNELRNEARRVTGLLPLLVLGALAVGCEKLRDELPDGGKPNVDRTGGSGGSQPATGGRGGSTGGGGAGGGGTSGGGTSGAGGVDAPPGAGDDGPACPVGETRCAPGAMVVEQCGVSGTWAVKETCSSVCANGACTGMCTPADKHCGTNQTPETCTPEGAWMPGTKCEFVCTGKGECAGVCTPGSKRCNPTSALVPETCNELGQWVAEAACPNLCSSGSCSGSCMPGTKRCRMDIPETCSPMGTWEPGTRCQFVCTGNGECTGECKPSTRRCAGTGGVQPELCDPNGRWAAEGSACPALCTNGTCMNCPNNTVLQNGMCVACGNANQACCSNGCPNGQNLFCRSGTCRLEIPNGSSCSSNATCASGNCVGGRCCNSSCGGDCQECSSGTCQNRNSGSCGSGRECRSGTCTACGGNGQTCCANNSCSSGRCTNGRCCSGDLVGSGNGCSCPSNRPKSCSGNRCIENDQCCDSCTGRKECRDGACRCRTMTHGDPCCDNQCNPQDRDSNGPDRLICEGGTCLNISTICGDSGQRCCEQGDPCFNGLTCTSGRCR
jgi:hypothetical protein